MRYAAFLIAATLYGQVVPTSVNWNQLNFKTPGVFDDSTWKPAIDVRVNNSDPVYNRLHMNGVDGVTMYGISSAVTIPYSAKSLEGGPIFASVINESPIVNAVAGSFFIRGKSPVGRGDLIGATLTRTSGTLFSSNWLHATPKVYIETLGPYVVGSVTDADHMQLAYTTGTYVQMIDPASDKTKLWRLTDAASTTSCLGGGSAISYCLWNGSAWTLTNSGNIYWYLPTYNWAHNLLMTDGDPRTGWPNPTDVTPANFQNEWDFNFYSPKSTVIAVSLGGASTVKPKQSIGFFVQALGSGFSANPIKWDTAFATQIGCCDVAFSAGPSKYLASAASQPIRMLSYDSQMGAMTSDIVLDGSGNLSLSAATTSLGAAGAIWFAAGGQNRVAVTAYGLGVQSGSIAVGGMAGGGLRHACWDNSGILGPC